jgi:hypothetical protein
MKYNLGVTGVVYDNLYFKAKIFIVIVAITMAFA